MDVSVHLSLIRRNSSELCMSIGSVFTNEEYCI